jgi:glutamate-1-semialdehyde 2,1-aminomutase
VVLGKSITSGIPLGAYGMTAAVARVLDSPPASFGEGWRPGHALRQRALDGGCRVMLEEVLPADRYDHAAALSERVSDGIEAVAAAHGLLWRAHRLFNRSGYTHGPELPANALEARASFDRELYTLQRLYMANRGVWDGIEMAGPACGIT